MDQFQRDLMRGTRRRVRRRVVDTDSDSEMPTTVPASSGTVRRLVGGQSRPRTTFISSDEERQDSQVRSTIPLTPRAEEVEFRVEQKRMRKVSAQQTRVHRQLNQRWRWRNHGHRG